MDGNEVGERSRLCVRARIGVLGTSWMRRNRTPGCTFDPLGRAWRHSQHVGPVLCCPARCSFLCARVVGVWFGRRCTCVSVFACALSTLHGFRDFETLLVHISTDTHHTRKQTHAHEHTHHARTQAPADSARNCRHERCMLLPPCLFHPSAATQRPTHTIAHAHSGYTFPRGNWMGWVRGRSLHLVVLITESPACCCSRRRAAAAAWYAVCQWRRRRYMCVCVCVCLWPWHLMR